MAQRICQQNRIASLNSVKSCKESRGENSDRTIAMRVLPSHFTPSRVFEQPPRHLHGVFQSLVSTSTTLSLTCGKRFHKYSAEVHSDAGGLNAPPLDDQVSTRDRRLPTQFQQPVPSGCGSQLIAVSGDFQLPNENHQNWLPLLSSNTVFKYSSQKERGRRTTSPCFKRNAP